LKDQAGNAKIELERLSNYYNGKFVPRFRYTAVYHSWNISKIISGPNSLRPLLDLTPTWAIWCNVNSPKVRVKYGCGQEHKNLQCLRNGA